MLAWFSAASPDDADVCLDLASVFEETYQRGGYANDLDYASRPSAPLGPDDLQWAMEVAKSPRGQ